MPRTINDRKIAKVTCRVPQETADEIAGYIESCGMYETHFNSAAYVAGARLLARQLNPEQFISSDMTKGIIEGLLSDGKIMDTMGRVIESVVTSGLLEGAVGALEDN